MVLLAFLSAGYFLALYVFFRPVQVRIWNYFSAVDVFMMACLILPFMVVPLLVSPRHRVTRYAWGVSAVMALDLVFFAVAEFGPLGTGHPSLESLALVLSGDGQASPRPRGTGPAECRVCQRRTYSPRRDWVSLFGRRDAIRDVPDGVVGTA